jgi:hypothetical protein
MGPARAISGHVFRADGKHQAVWRAKYRLPDGRQVQKTIGRVWTERGRPRAGYFTKRTAQAWLRDVLEQAERGVLPGMVRTRHTFADAADEYLRYLTDDRQRKPSSVLGSRPYCSTLTRTALLFRTDRSSAIAALGARCQAEAALRTGVVNALDRGAVAQRRAVRCACPGRDRHASSAAGRESSSATRSPRGRHLRGPPPG